MPDLLIELFSEEIPARMQTRAAEDLKKLVTNGLVEAGLTYGSAAAFSTPRRLTLALGDMLAASPRTVEERKGPKADAPEKAIEGFLRGAGLTRDQLEERDTPKGKILFAMIEKPGRPAAEIVAEVLEQTIRNFPWPKSMRWGSGSLKWVRPLHSILCIMSAEDGAEVVALDVDGITSGDETRGHRFLAPEAIKVSSFEDYAAKLKRAFVVLSAEERAETIWNDATNMAFANGLEVVEDAGLLAEVAGLVEYPVVLMGQIADDFLGLPPEVLQTSMREHQKFFSVRNPKTGQIERFITVANRTTADNGATILAGNEKVLSARLADAKFFWENDLRTATSDKGMSAWVKSLENVTFHNKLGTQAELIERMAVLARELAPMVGADADEAEQAARLAKADLSSEMVYEFPELQGLMGSYYAKAAGKSDAVAAAAKEHYAPLGPSDDVPTAPVSVAVSLAEKIDKLTGFWAIDEKPTGSKDPFALRRAALGVIRMLVENDISLHMDRFIDAQLVRNKGQSNGDLKANLIHDLVEEIAEHGVFGAAFKTVKARLAEGEGNAAFEALGEQVPDKSVDLLGFLHDRLKVYLKDQGIRHDIIDACIAMEGNDDLTLLVKRARALSETLSTDDGENLIQGFKRANNILTQAEAADGVEYSYGADIKFAETDEEKALFAALDKAEAAIAPAMAAQDFTTAMSAMAALRGPIDAFFDAVQVNSDNGTVRRNRLNLLSRIRTTCSSVADLTRIDG
ncbi:glycine--tRNA ligase subunit beta [Sulfitobacter mediterraneus]|uniref:glycine--tRNA ligase subunit beta n=1 Tax=Sulfitobacter mediterraneus TaxID=83219 RepID=UPI001933D25E|nr:glycine--tRNA ligase subunit beta [Sulfitobacter mediterraneus]MBM1632533.1 glycine--tRNA ligase subunit beta [Sulfitobacter mediterraneus]MBM1640350.1 glycine--tRNA ligase subunit beta [Sulfitobacter mediterraneus]MBM1644398.1 glycine--tRNA ligase subunit beta [Sulfitobacter mediterraneus]MBM1648445.1 glycine--tRNA ligase subunit beta [Sulfitobacter mediterraneus]MBM1652490.1 glycine--tRNA ligase subunit beta [Sulfitobacter mediterraneus]